MDNLLKILELANSKKIPLAVKTFLNLVFVTSITSTIFVKFYYQYQILDLTNYKLIFNFLITGQFFIPLIIFLSSWFLTGFFIEAIFFGINIWAGNKLKDFFKRNYLSPKEAGEVLVHFRKTMEEKAPKLNSIPTLITIYKKIKSEFNYKQLKALNEASNKMQQEAISNFKLYTRGLICSIIYYNILPYFGWFLLTVCIFIFLIAVILNFLLYQFGENLTLSTVRFISFVEKEIKEFETKNESERIPDLTTLDSSNINR